MPHFGLRHGSHATLPAPEAWRPHIYLIREGRGRRGRGQESNGREFVFTMVELGNGWGRQGQGAGSGRARQFLSRQLPFGHAFSLHVLSHPCL